MQAEVCGAWTARSKGVFPGVIYGLALRAAPRPSVPKTLARSRSPSPCSAGHLNGDESDSSGRLQRPERAGARCGARACNPKCVRLFSITGASRIAALICNSPTQFGQCSRSRSNTRLSNLAQLRRTGRWCAQFASHSAAFAACAGASGTCGTTSARSLALDASTPWKRIRCSRGLGTRAAGVEAEAVDVGAKMLLEVRILGHGALYRQHLLASTRTEGDAVSARRSLQPPAHAGLISAPHDGQRPHRLHQSQ